MGAEWLRALDAVVFGVLIVGAIGALVGMYTMPQWLQAFTMFALALGALRRALRND